MLKYLISTVVEPATEQAWMVDTRSCTLPPGHSEVRVCLSYQLGRGFRD